MEIFICPDCSSDLENLCACGSSSYFCKRCKKLISRSRIVKKGVESIEQDVDKRVEEDK